MIIDALMIGENQFSDAHGLIYPNGTWKNEEYKECIKAKTPSPPPLGPPPPPPIVNITHGI